MLYADTVEKSRCSTECGGKWLMVEQRLQGEGFKMYLGPVVLRGDNVKYIISHKIARYCAVLVLETFSCLLSTERVRHDQQRKINFRTSLVTAEKTFWTGESKLAWQRWKTHGVLNWLFPAIT
jgi:hypothetical protein